MILGGKRAVDTLSDAQSVTLRDESTEDAGVSQIGSVNVPRGRYPCCSHCPADSAMAGGHGTPCSYHRCPGGQMQGGAE